MPASKAVDGGFSQNSLYFSLLSGNWVRRLVRAPLARQPTSPVSPGRFRFSEKSPILPRVSEGSARLRTVSCALPALKFANSSGESPIAIFQYPNFFHRDRVRTCGDWFACPISGASDLEAIMVTSAYGLPDVP